MPRRISAAFITAASAPQKMLSAVTAKEVAQYRGEHVVTATEKVEDAEAQSAAEEKRRRKNVRRVKEGTGSTR